MVFSPHGNARYFLDGDRPLWYMLPLSPRGNTRYCLDSNRPLWYILLRYSATTVIYGIFYILYFFGLLPRACGVGTFTEHEKHQTSNLIMKYSGEHNKRQCPDHRQTFAANSCVCLFLLINSGRQIRWKYQPGSHRIFHLPSFCGACLYYSRDKDSAVPFPRRP